MDRNKITVLFILGLFALFAFPLLSEAEDGLEGSIEVGGALTDLDSKSFKYGEYTGVNDDSIYFAGNVDLSYNRNAFFLDLRTDNIGLDNRSLYLETGRYGRYKLFLEYDELPKLISNNSQTILNGAGTNSLTLPSGWVRGNQTTNLTNLTSSKKDIELRTDRKAYGAGFSSSFSDFDFKISFKKEEKEGTKSIGGTIGNSGGTTRSVVLPEPVDYTTDELKAALAYSGEIFQLELGYYLSQFTNGNKSLTWENPYNMCPGCTSSFTVLSGLDDPQYALISLPPDNQHQRFSLSGGINLPFATRISAIAEYGIMEQNDTFLPYSNNPNSTITTPLPRGAADAEIDTAHFELNISSRPLSRLGLTAKYRYYETDNKTPQDLFLYVNNDTGGAAAQSAANSSEALYNLPYDSTQNLLKLDASYYLFNGTTLKLGYDYDIVERDYREVNRTIENTYRARLNSNLSSFASAGINLAYGERRIFGQYDEAALYDAYHTEAYINTVTPTNIRFDTHPDSRKFDIANRDRTRYGANITFFPHYTTTTGLYYSATKDDYEGSLIGLKYSKNNAYTVDVTYTPMDIVSTYAYYTREEIDSQQASRYFTSAAKATQFTDTSRDWWADHSDNVDTVGVGTSIGFMENRLTVNADYSFSESTSNINFKTGTSLTAQDMLELETKIQSVALSGKYKLNKHLTVGVGYQYENYKSDDWATDSVDPASTILANVLTLSGSVPDYEAHQAMLTVAYNW